MAQFIYKVRDRQGRERQGRREAQGQEELITQLQNEGLLVTSVVREERAKKKVSVRSALHIGVTIDDLILFARQLATMLEAGVTLLKALDVLTKQIESRILLEVAQKIKRDISAGSSFRDALAKHPRIFSEFWVHMIETGEASGALPVALSQLAHYLESAAAMRRKVISSLIYPAVLIIIAIGALIVFTVYIIPIFSRVFDSFDLELPAITRMVITFSKIARKYFLVFLAIAGSLGYLIYRY
ncbi:MAG: type II secretion system F family protein, partial [Omnitrophica bacterium]|nr:type II secretion system F family protein [Candidatus Omnitrophota bacterium]